MSMTNFLEHNWRVIKSKHRDTPCDSDLTIHTSTTTSDKTDVYIFPNFLSRMAGALRPASRVIKYFRRKTKALAIWGRPIADYLMSNLGNHSLLNEDTSLAEVHLWSLIFYLIKLWTITIQSRSFYILQRIGSMPRVTWPNWKTGLSTSVFPDKLNYAVKTTTASDYFKLLCGFCRCYVISYTYDFFFLNVE